jgi:hypothetical protein
MDSSTTGVSVDKLNLTGQNLGRVFNLGYWQSAL